MEGGNGVVYFGTITCQVAGSACWSINTTQVDDAANGAPLASDATPRKLIGFEADISVRRPSTIVSGIALAGSSSAQPAAANGFICGPLGGPALWHTCLLVPDGAARTGAYFGSLATIANSASAPLDLYYRDSANAWQLIRAQAVSNMLQVSHLGYANGLGFVPAPGGRNPTLTATCTDARVGLSLATVGGAAISADAPLVANHLLAANDSFVLGPALRGAPASSWAACAPGTVRFDESCAYICVTADTWKRAALSSW